MNKLFVLLKKRLIVKTRSLDLNLSFILKLNSMNNFIFYPPSTWQIEIVETLQKYM